MINCNSRKSFFTDNLASEKSTNLLNTNPNQANAIENAIRLAQFVS